MTPKQGRPVKGLEKRDKSLQLRLSQGELDLLKFCADAMNVTRTDVVVRGIHLCKQELGKKKK